MKRSLACLLVVLIAFALRTHALARQSLWYDEAVTAQVAGQGLAELTRWTADDIQPPLYYYVEAGWTALAGRSEWALRFPSVFFSLLAIPLLGSLARRLFGARGGPAALSAGVLAAVSPLYVYYAQEARMYALLIFLSALSGYALLRAATRKEGRRWWRAFVPASAAMLYTHYFGVFVLAAYAICLAGVGLAAVVRGRGAWPGVRRAGARAVAAFLAVGLMYLPWLPAMLNRYRVDTSYWQGALKLGEAVRHLVVSFVGGAPDTMLEADAARWALPVLAAWGIAVVALWISRRRTSGLRGLAVPVLLVALVVPVVSVLVLASRTPKFNPRYLLLASPPYLLLLAGGIGALWSARRVGWRVLAVVVALVALAPALLGLRNWYGDPAFTKAQWREAAAYVTAHLAADEGVVLVSGHAAPAWDYYASGVTAVRLPDIDILDVNAVLGFGDAPLLQKGLAGKRGAWLVTWQDEVVDPVGFVPSWLDRAGAEQPLSAQFWQLGVRHWRFDGEPVFPDIPQPQHPAPANFDHKLALLGWDDPQDGLLTVYWQTLNTLTEDYQVSLVLLDPAGNEAGRWDGRPAGYDYPTTRWQPGAALFGRYPLPVPPGPDAEGFTVSLAIYGPAAPDGLDLRDVADNPAGKRVTLGPFHLKK